MKNLKQTLIVTVIALLAPACGGDFDPYSRVKTLRVLGIQSEPPAPAPGKTATFKALVYTPKPDAELSYEWSWCPLAGPARDGYPCLITVADITKLAGEAAAATLPPYNLGTGPTAMFTHTVDPTLLKLVCPDRPDPNAQAGRSDGGTGAPAGQIGDLRAAVQAGGGCEGGFPMQLRVKIKSGTEVIDSVRTVRLRLEGESPSNQNPAIDGLLRLSSKETKDQGDLLGDEPGITLPRRIEARLRALVKREHIEKYSGFDARNMPAELYERLNLAWFVETGDLDSETTGFIEGAKGLVFEDSLINKWKPGKVKDYEKASARVLVVIRDNRGGIGWTTGAVNLEAKP